MKSGSLNLLEPSGPVEACNGIALPFCMFWPPMGSSSGWLLKHPEGSYMSQYESKISPLTVVLTITVFLSMRSVFVMQIKWQLKVLKSSSLNPLAYYFFITHGAPTNTNFLVENGNLVHLYFIHAKLIFKRAFHQLSNGKRHVMPSTDRRLELKAKDIDGSDRLTAGCVCQWVKDQWNAQFLNFILGKNSTCFGQIYLSVTRSLDTVFTAIGIRHIMLPVC